jgi:RNA polymerase sigma-70 factor (ECF subfamily)
LTVEEFKNLYNQYFESIRNYIYYRSGNKDLANDISQETFIKVWKKRTEINKEKIKALLYKIAGDEFINYLRKEKLKRQYVEDSLKFKIENNNDNQDEEIRKSKFEKLLKKMSEKQRAVILMSKREGLTNKEISNYLDISLKAVEKRMTQAIKFLKENINE